MLGKRGWDDDQCKSSKKQKTFDLQDLSPFDLLISNPPLVYYSNYSNMTSYATKKIQGQANEPFVLNSMPLKILSNFGLAEDATQCWRSILELLNSNCDLQNMWNKIADVDSILCVSDSPENSSLVSEGQAQLWWIKQAQSWFSKVPNKLENSYPKLGMNALIIEAFYRFVWARYTFLHYQQGTLNQQINSTSNTMNVHSPNQNLEEEIMDAADMGISDSEEEEEEEKEVEDRDMDVEDDENKKLTEENESGYIYLPNVVDLFFKQNNISKTFDKIESKFFDEIVNSEDENSLHLVYWNIEPVIDSFVILCINQSQEQNSLAQKQTQTKQTILAKLLKLYLKRHVPFLRKLGIIVNPNAPFVSFSFIIIFLHFPFLIRIIRNGVGLKIWI